MFNTVFFYSKSSTFYSNNNNKACRLCSFLESREAFEQLELSKNGMHLLRRLSSLSLDRVQQMLVTNWLQRHRKDSGHRQKGFDDSEDPVQLKDLRKWK